MRGDAIRGANRRETLSLTEIKAEELRMLVAFRDLCETGRLRYSLCGGTLLGAVRHRGFIPWDDDIDVCMPRPDYERLLRMSGSVFELCGYDLAGFERQVEVEFEGERFAAMGCWDEYLTGIYGDYMRLPPEEKRTAHGLVAWRVETGDGQADKMGAND